MVGVKVTKVIPKHRNELVKKIPGIEKEFLLSGRLRILPPCDGNCLSNPAA